MYAVMFYVILNKRKLHFPLAKNVMHSPSLEHYGMAYVYLELRRTLRYGDNAGDIQCDSRRRYNFQFYSHFGLFLSDAASNSHK